MTQPVQPSAQPSIGDTPYAQPAYGQQVYGQQPGGATGPAGYVVPSAAAPRPGRLGAGLLAGGLTMIGLAVLYGVVMRVLAKDDGSTREFFYAALAVGLAVGAAIGKVGGRHRALPFAGLVMAVVGVFLGEIFGDALILSHISDGGLSVTNLLFQQFGLLVKGWEEGFDVLSALIYVIAAIEGFVVTKRTAQA